MNKEELTEYVSDFMAEMMPALVEDLVDILDGNPMSPGWKPFIRWRIDRDHGEITLEPVMRISLLGGK